MKTRIKILSIILALIATSCKKEAITPTCKVLSTDYGGSTKSFVYDSNGRITQMNRSIENGLGSGIFQKYVFTLFYDNSGLLIKSVYTLDGKDNGTDTYTYANGRISKVITVLVDGSKTINNIKYDSNGRILEFTFETGDPTIDYKQYFEYDNNGIRVRRGYADWAGNKQYEEVTKPVGVVKIPEQFLANNGLPFDIFLGFSWRVAEGGVGTTYEAFSADNTGKLVSIGMYKETSVKTNSQGYVIQSTVVDASNTNLIENFTLTDCN